MVKLSELQSSLLLLLVPEEVLALQSTQSPLETQGKSFWKNANRESTNSEDI